MPVILSEDDAQILTILVLGLLALTLWSFWAYDDDE